jgi:trigger factor
MYGKDVFYNDALDNLLPKAYGDAVDEHGVRVISKPDIHVSSAAVGKGAECYAEVEVEPDVYIDDYEGIRYKAPSKEVTDEMVDAEIKKRLNKNARIIPVEGRPLKEGDTAVIDFEGFVDGVPFKGGKGEDYPLVLGSRTFVDTFEEQLAGRSVGDSLDVGVTFPADYAGGELAGKAAVFSVTVKSASYREIPEADDDFAQDASEFDTFAEYREDIKKRMEKTRADEAEREAESLILDGLAARARMDIPDLMFENEIDGMVHNFQNRVRASGMPYDAYMSYIGLTPMELRAQYRENAEKSVRARLALQAVADKIGFEISDGEMEHEIARLAQENGMDAAKMKEYMTERDRKALKRDIKIQKAVEAVVSSAEEE